MLEPASVKNFKGFSTQLKVSNNLDLNYRSKGTSGQKLQHYAKPINIIIMRYV